MAEKKRNSAYIKGINRTTSFQTIGIVLIANVFLALIYYKTLYVRQADISTSKLDQMPSFNNNGLCMNGAQGAFLTKLPYLPDCDNTCLCFTFEPANDSMRKHAEFTIVDSKNVRVGVKSTARIPRDFERTMQHIGMQLGYGDASITTNYKLDTV